MLKPAYARGRRNELAVSFAVGSRCKRGSSRGGQTRAKAPHWRFAIYIAGKSPKSMTASGNGQRLCDAFLNGNYEIELFDLMLYPEMAQLDHVFAVPTRVRRVPYPIKRIIRDQSDYERTLSNVDLPLDR